MFNSNRSEERKQAPPPPEERKEPVVPRLEEVKKLEPELEQAEEKPADTLRSQHQRSVKSEIQPGPKDISIPALEE